MKANNKTFSISFIIIAVLVIFSVIGTTSLLILSKGYSESALHTLAEDIILRTVDDAAEHVNALIKPAVDAVNILEAQVPDGAEMSDDEADNHIRKVMIKTLKTMRDVYTVYFANEKGEFFLVGKRQRFENDKRKYFFNKKIEIKNGERFVEESWFRNFVEIERNKLPEDTYDPRVRPWYRRVKNFSNPSWTEPYIFYITKMPGITYAKPIFKNGSFVGVVAADLEIKTVSDFMMDSAFTGNTNIFAVDKKGNILAHNRFASKEYKNGKVPQITNIGDSVIKYMSESGGIHAYDSVINLSLNGSDYKALSKPFNVSGLNIILSMYTPVDDYLGHFKSKFKKLFYISMFLLAMAVIASRYVSKELARPFVQLTDATENAKELNFDRPINIKTSFYEVSATQANFNQMLENLKNYQSANELLSETLHNAHVDTLYRLAMAAEHKDQYTYDHLKRVSDISVMISEIIGMSKHDINQIRHASAMHDVGKLGIPDNILMKPGRLTSDEFEIIKRHSELGAEILKNPSSEVMNSSKIIALTHHEKWDGTGYPYSKEGVDIPIYGRIVAIADVIDALLSQRPYKEPYSFDKTINIVKAERGRHFDPELTDVVTENQDILKKLIGGED